MTNQLTDPGFRITVNLDKITFSSPKKSGKILYRIAIEVEGSEIVRG
jgi:hypothetical protein